MKRHTSILYKVYALHHLAPNMSLLQSNANINSSVHLTTVLSYSIYKVSSF